MSPAEPSTAYFCDAPPTDHEPPVSAEPQPSDTDRVNPSAANGAIGSSGSATVTGTVALPVAPSLSVTTSVTS